MRGWFEGLSEILAIPIVIIICCRSRIPLSYSAFCLLARYNVPISSILIIFAVSTENERFISIASLLFIGSDPNVGSNTVVISLFDGASTHRTIYPLLDARSDPNVVNDSMQGNSETGNKVFVLPSKVAINTKIQKKSSIWKD